MRPGVDLCQFGVTRIWPSPISLLSLVDPFGKPGWHAAVCAAARPRPAIGMERAATCGGAEEPSPSPTWLHISAGFPSGFLSCFQSNHPQTFKLPRLWGRLCHPHQPGLASGGLGHSIHTLALAHRLGARLCTTNQETKAYRRDNNSQAHSWMPPSCNRLAELIPTQPCRLGESRIVFWDFTSFFPFARICDDGQGQGDTAHSTHHTHGV